MQFEKDVMQAVNSLFDAGIKYNLDKVDICKSVTAISELGTNLVKYAHKGQLRITMDLKEDIAMLEARSVDQGPGIPDIAQAMKENHSSGKSLGVGLPSIKRLADTFEIESSFKGTAIKITKKIRRDCD